MERRLLYCCVLIPRLRSTGTGYAKSFTTSHLLCKRFVKGKTLSSSLWLTRHISDPYVRQAQIEGYRCRSAYKLIEIDQKHNLLKKGSVVVDCGAAPGAWSQVAASKMMNTIVKPKKSPPSTIQDKKKQNYSSEYGLIVAVDINNIDPIEGVTTVMGDFTVQGTQDKIREILNGRPIDLIMSDMAPNASGFKAMDQECILKLAQSVFDFSKVMLAPHGSLLCKIWQGPETKGFMKEMSVYFATVNRLRPKATRKESSEFFIIAKDFKH
ncbi:ribosomal RNA large subunit methyltransferase E-like [Dysidea avara]|uniref:ribosomal RNA large subunit methyltransferase E-like n=1 Tax=Dysidea avara TaxID=196820 RepID=UPI00333174C3